MDEHNQQPRFKNIHMFDDGAMNFHDPYARIPVNKQNN